MGVCPALHFSISTPPFPSLPLMETIQPRTLGRGNSLKLAQVSAKASSRGPEFDQKDLESESRLCRHGGFDSLQSLAHPIYINIYINICI